MQYMISLAGAAGERREQHRFLLRSLLVNMAVAIAAVNAHHGFFSTDGQNGFELPLTFAVVAIVIGFVGPGPVSVDHLLGVWLGRRGRRHA